MLLVGSVFTGTRGSQQVEGLEELGRCMAGWEGGDSLGDRSGPVKLRNLAGQGMVLQGKIKMLDLVLLSGKVEWLGSAGFPCSSVHPCNSSLYKHWHVIFQRGSLSLKIPIWLGSLCLREAAGLEIWEALSAKETTGHCFCVCPSSSPLARLLVEILPPSLAPLCLLAAQVGSQHITFMLIEKPSLQIQQLTH